MITLTQLNKAICDKVRTALDGAGLKITLSPEDLAEPIRRPSIKVSIADGTSGRDNSRMRRTGVTVRVYFFAKDRQRPKKENLQIREVLSEAFLEEIKVGEFWIPVMEDVEFMVTDGVLIATLDLDYLELLPEQKTGEYESIEMLENLHFD